MRPGLTISCIGHAGVLLWGLAAFAAKPNEAKPVEALPVEFVSATDFSQLTAGVKNTPKVLPEPKPLADKSGEPKPVKEQAPKVADKPEIKTESAVAPQPKPTPKSEPKSAEKAEPTSRPKSEQKAAEKTEERNDAKPKADQIAEELKKDEAKKPSKSEKKRPEFKPEQIAEELRKTENKKPSPKFDANQVAALLDKREPRRQVAIADTLNGAASLGAASGHAAQLSQSELDALRARLSQCWSPPPGIEATTKIYVVLRVLFKPDGSVAHDPAVIEDSASPLSPALNESAKRALLLCQPFTMLKPEHYDQWKDIEVKFDPQQLLGG